MFTKLTLMIWITSFICLPSCKIFNPFKMIKIKTILSIISTEKFMSMRLPKITVTIIIQFKSFSIKTYVSLISLTKITFFSTFTSLSSSI